MKKLLQLQPLPSAHPHATGVVVYLALLVKSEAFGVNNVRFYRSLIVQLWICKQALQGCTWRPAAAKMSTCASLVRGSENLPRFKPCIKKSLKFRSADICWINLLKIFCVVLSNPVPILYQGIQTKTTDKCLHTASYINSTMKNGQKASLPLTSKFW